MTTAVDTIELTETQIEQLAEAGVIQVMEAAFSVQAEQRIEE